MDGFQKELLGRLPLAQATMRVMGYALDSKTLEGVFELHRGRCYEGILTFQRLVQLVLDALTVHGGSGHRAFREAQAQGELPVAEQNVYRKLRHIPEALSMALLDHGSARLAELLALDQPAVHLPGSLKDGKVIAFDGKKIKKAAKRLKVLRKVPGKLLGGKLLVSLDVRTGLVLGMNAHADGERHDVPLVAPAVRPVRRRVRDPILWMGDRQFGNLEVPQSLSAREGDAFLLRCPRTLQLDVDPRRGAVHFQDDEGRTVRQEWGWMGGERDPRRRYVRRITLEGREDPVILITNLLDDEAVPGKDLLETYRQRWGIERVFQQVTEVFNLQTLIGASPQATIFQSSLCFLLYNIIHVLRAYLAQDGDQPAERVSSEKLFWDVRDQLATWKHLGDATLAVQMLRWDETPTDGTPATMTDWLKRTLRDRWKDLYIKAPPQKRKAPLPATAQRAKVPKGHGGHTSTWRLLQAAKAEAHGGRR